MKAIQTGKRVASVGLLVLTALVLAACQAVVGPIVPERSMPGLSGLRLYVEEDSPAQRQVAAWESTRPADAAYMARIADEAQAIWFGDWTRDVRSGVAAVMASSARAGAVPVLVAYNIPDRDCGLYSAGGARNGSAYLSWVREFARGLGAGPAIVILEPDAAAGVDCLSSSGRGERLSLLREAISILKAARAWVYVDAGHAHWKTAREMAPVLRSAGVLEADGFALNVSNYHATAANVRYGQELSALLGGARFVIDTSRNGVATAGPDEWCNAPGQGLGERPRTLPGPEGVDAYLWIKRPGESDGTCNGGPSAGDWWPSYALELAQRQPVALAAGP